MAVGADAEKCHRRWTIAPHFCSEPSAAGDEFLRRELIGARGGAIHQVGDAIAALEQLALFRRMQQPVAEARRMQRGPEAVAGPREVVPRGGGVEAGIDADEEHAQAGRNDIGNALAFGGPQLRRGWFMPGG